MIKKIHLFVWVLTFLFTAFASTAISQTINISGNVWVDTNADDVVQAEERATDFGATIFVNLVRPNGTILASTTVGSNGNYILANIPQNLTSNHRIVVSNSAINTSGNRMPGAFYIFKNVVGASNPIASSQGTAIMGEILVRTGTSNIQNQNFRVASQTPLICPDGTAYQVAVKSGGTNSTLFSYSVVSGARAEIITTNYVLNSLTYSSVTENFLWATANNFGGLVRLGAGGGTALFQIKNFPSGLFNSGVEIFNSLGEGGYMLFYQGTQSEYYVVDVDPARSTYLELVDPTNNFVLKTTAPFGTPIVPINVADFAYNHLNNTIYSIESGSLGLMVMNPNTGTYTVGPEIIGINAAGGAYGGIFSDMSGNVYGLQNNTGRFVKINVDTNTATLISTTLATASNDAASCPFAEITCDEDVITVMSSPAVCANSPIILTVNPEGRGPFTYQWERSVNGGSSWETLQGTSTTLTNGSYSGAHTNTITVTPFNTVFNNHLYRAKVTSNLCETYSSTVTLQVYEQLFAPVLKASREAVVCPATTFNLNHLIRSTTPASASLVFYSSPTLDIASRIADPTKAEPGSYYARYENPACVGPVAEAIILENCFESFGCANGLVYQVAQDNGASVSSLYSYDVKTGVRSQMANLDGSAYNGLIYNSIDNTLWASSSGKLKRIAPNGRVMEYTIPNLPAITFNTGAELDGGYMMLIAGSASTNEYYVVDIEPSRTTYLTLVNPKNNYSAITAAPFASTTVSGFLNARDMVYLSSTGLAYGITDGAQGRLMTLNPKTGNVVINGSNIANIDASASYGALFADITGTLYTYQNNTGNFYRISKESNSAVMLSTSTSSGNNDGASCPFALIEYLPFNCEDGVVYQVAINAGDSFSTLYQFDAITGLRTAVAELPQSVNAVIYNSTDNLLWASINGGTGRLVQIDREGATVEHVIPDLPAVSFNSGAELPDGYMVLYNTNSSRYYVVDVNNDRSDTYLRLVDPMNGFVLETSDFGTSLATPLQVADIVYLPNTGKFYGVTPASQLVSFNPLTAETSTEGLIMNLPPTAVGFGALFSDASGTIYAYENTSGKLYKIDVSSKTAYYLSTSMTSANNDGGSCPSAMICDVNLTEDSSSTSNACIGSPLTLSANATGSGTLTYQWQVSTDGGTTWTNLSSVGATTADGMYSGASTAALVLTPATISWSNNQYRVIVTSDICVIESSARTIQVAVSPTEIPAIITVNDCIQTAIDLASRVSSTTPSEYQLVFFTSSNLTGLVVDPSNITNGDYYAAYQNTGGCLGPASAVIKVVNCNLPVSLAGFEVEKTSENHVVLRWSTTLEVNSERFEIERSKDAKNWVNIGEISSQGDAKTHNRYLFTDSEPLNGLTHYRLKMVDKDGTYEYSTLKSIQIKQHSNVVIYPNPVSNVLFLENANKVQSITLFTLSGKVVLRTDSYSVKGLEIGALPEGIYILKVVDQEGNVSTDKIIKNK